MVESPGASLTGGSWQQLAKKKSGGALAPPELCFDGGSRPPGDYSPEVPTQPVSETSTVTPSGAVYFTSTLPVR
jgi:hypothetical protein